MERVSCLVFEVMVGHSCDAGVAPHVLSRLHHIDDSVDGQDDAHDADGCPLTGHQREGEEVTAHGHTCIADGRHHGDDEPQQRWWAG